MLSSSAQHHAAGGAHGQGPGARDAFISPRKEQENISNWRSSWRGILVNVRIGPLQRAAGLNRGRVKAALRTSASALNRPPHGWQIPPFHRQMWIMSAWSAPNHPAFHAWEKMQEALNWTPRSPKHSSRVKDPEKNDKNKIFTWAHHLENSLSLLLTSHSIIDRWIDTVLSYYYFY